MTAECKWCFQILMLDIPNDSTEQEIEQAIIETCNCSEACRRRQLRNAASKARDNVRELCLNVDEQSGLKPCDVSVVDIVENAIDNMVHGSLNELTLKMPNRGTLSVKLSNGGKFTVLRKIQRGQKLEAE